MDREILRRLDWSTTELHQLTGKVAIVTGANALASIGGNIAYQLALRGAKVYIVSRNLDRCKAAIKEMLARSHAISISNLKPLVADMGDYAAVRLAAEKFLEQEERLDILVNNAGIFPLTLEFDCFGVNKVMATNYLGPFVLIKTLLPILERTAKSDPASDVRIVNVSSTAINAAPPITSFASLEAWNDPFGGNENPDQHLQRYAYSKVAGLLLTEELQRRFDQMGVGVLVTAPHPGVVATPGLQNVWGAESEFYKASWTPLEGALTPLWCAAHPDVRKREFELKGKFIMPFGALKEQDVLVNKLDASRGLWDFSEHFLDTVIDY